MQKLLNVLALLVLLASCDPMMDEVGPSVQQAYVPVYRTPDNVYVTKFAASRPIKTAGKQYVFGQLLLQNEANEGIHLTDVGNPAEPKKLGFIEIPLCTEMAVRQGFLYANNYADLVVYDLRGPSEPKFVGRIKDVFPPVNQEYPPFFNVAFECPDKAKGVVVGWELKSNVTTRCRR